MRARSGPTEANRQNIAVVAVAVADAGVAPANSSNRQQTASQASKWGEQARHPGRAGAYLARGTTKAKTRNLPNTTRIRNLPTKAKGGRHRTRRRAKSISRQPDEHL